MKKFVTNMIGAKYVTSQPYDLERSFQDSAPGIPIFVFLSPGVDVAASVEQLGSKLGFTSDAGRYVSVSLGQGQESIAMNALTNAHKNGGWVLLQNVHLTIDWTSGPLEKRVDKLSEGAHSDFRLFLSAEPPPALERPLPISLLQNSIKLTNEPPEGLRPNLRRAYSQFNEEILESCAKQVGAGRALFIRNSDWPASCMCLLIQSRLAAYDACRELNPLAEDNTQLLFLWLCSISNHLRLITRGSICCVWCVPQAEFRTIIFALCYFHAALLERKKFGVGNLPGATSGIGWNMNYPFNTGDLLCCGQCTANYLENNVKV
eukprot:GHUV01032930.1.p1 GENE.GHUV01032930.1~~GHUV01032930.1.p1  ORF type:complete len:334 (+),score=75.78 GHUV01032930.1:46-1002(+)